MITIRLIDARRGLHQQCESLFRDKMVADQIYWYLCDGLEECEEVEPERKKGKWIKATGMMPPEFHGRHCCSECGNFANMEPPFGNREDLSKFCPNCGADMRERKEE